MEIERVSLHELRKMNDSEGLILQGCGGDLKEWADGINDMLTTDGILQNGSRFENVYAFKNGELTCLLFPFEDVQLDVGKLAIEENIPIGRNRLFRWLKGKGVLMANNLPYQKYIDRGYFAVKESVFEVDGMKKTYQQTFVTGKGQRFVIDLLKKYYGKEFLQ